MEFTLETVSTDGDFVIKRGKVFEAGKYLDKTHPVYCPDGYEMTAADLSTAVTKFNKAVPNRLEHKNTLLNGKLGDTQKIYLSDNPNELYGEVRVPIWFDNLNEGKPIPVSCEWNPKDKTLGGMGLVVDPRVPDAVVMAAFSVANPEDNEVVEFAKKNHTTHTGQRHIQNLHDETIRAGAVCNAPINMASKKENSAIQAAHDLMSQHGATCEDGSTRPMYGSYFSFTKEEDIMDVKNMDDAQKKGFLASVASLLGFNTAPDNTGNLTAISIDFKTSPEYLKMQADLEVSNKQNENLKEQAVTKIKSDAIIFADTQIKNRKAFPAQKELITAQYFDAAFADLNGADKITFTDGKERTKTDIVTEFWDSQKAHEFSREFMAEQLQGSNPIVLDNDGKLLFNKEDLLKMTSLGQEVLSQNGKGN